MFFSTYVLTKKGPLAKVWLAAHWDRRLTRNEVKVVDLSQTILYIVRPVVPIALRTSGELLVGVVRIYVLKVKHLLKEATEATLFLRVATMTSKHSVTASGSAAAKAASADEKATTGTMDGLLVRGKGDVEAVTFDWSAEVAAKHGSLPDAANALSEARFDAIADLLGAQQVQGLHKDDGLLAQAWYTVEPSSQAVEELHSTQQDYDEIAKVRADLMAFTDRVSGSSASKSKSSLSSIEKGRGSAAVLGDGLLGDDIPFPAVGDELDVGVPRPDELASNVPLLLSGAGVPEDPFAVPDLLSAEEEEAAAAAAARAASRPERKVRPVNVLDLAATTLSRETFERRMADRSDVLNSEPRRGPLDEREEADRYTITCTAAPSEASAAGAPVSSSAASSAAAAEVLSIADAALLSAQPNPALRSMYAAVLQQQVAEAVAEAAAAAAASHAAGAAAGAGRRSEFALAGLPEESLTAAASEDEEAAAAAGQQQQQQQRDSLKRARADAESDDPATLSANALDTLRRVRTEAAKAQHRRLPQQREAVAKVLVGATCTLKDVCNGLRRRDAARTFVDVLALASKQFVSVKQSEREGPVDITLREASATVALS